MASARTVPGLAAEDVASANTVPAAAPSGPRAPREGGQVLGNRYEILAELGSGGEGVVYRARDLKADVIVALKLVGFDDGSDHRLKRLRRELQMARRVTHPNVVRIYDLVELPGRFGLSMEMIEGESLADRIDRGPLSRDELVRLASALASALAAAHAAGVTHRDLKPGNVLLRSRDGHAMVTDFGISRLHDTPDETSPAAPNAMPLRLTREGAIIGTPQYMAPEQLEGRTDIGPPADIYAFGAVVYEAATGVRLHDADSLGELRRLRLESSAPSLRDLRPDLPPALGVAVERSLARNPGDRYASGAELLAALEPAASPRPARWGWLVWAPVIACLAGAALAMRPRVSETRAIAPATAPMESPAPRPTTLRVSNVHRVTFGESCEEFPTFTPDSRALVYDGTVAGDSSLYELDLAESAHPRRLTRVDGWDIAPSVSPTGDRLAFVRLEGERVGAFVMPLDGSAPPRMVVKGAVRPSWTPDGRAIWAGTGSPLGAYEVATGALVRVLRDTPPARTAQTVTLANGSLLAAFPLQEAGGENRARLALYAPDGAARELLTADLEEVLAVSPDQRHAFASRKLAGAGVELIDVPLDGGPVTSLASTGISARQGLSFAPDGKRVVWSACAETSQLIAFGAHARSVRALKDDLVSPRSISVVPGSSEMIVVSARTGTYEPWLMALSGDAPARPLASGSLRARDVVVSQDGAHFVVSTAGGGLYAGSLRGDTDLRRLTFDEMDSSPAFRGANVVFTRRSSDAPPQVMMVPIEGGAATPLLEPGSDSAAPSPTDGRVAYLAGATAFDAVPEIWDGRTGTRRALSPELKAGRYDDLRFSPDGKRVVLVRGHDEVVEVDATTGRIVRTLSTPEHDQLAHPTYTQTGIVAIRVRWQGNLWMGDVSL